MRQLAAIVLLMVSSSASAQVVYRCVAKGKPVSFQSEPCAAGSRTTRVLHAAPDRRPAPVYTAAAPPAVQNTVNYYDDTPTQWQQRRANCAAAKQRREYNLSIAGLNRTFDLLRQLDEDVRKSCKGF